MRDMFTGLVQCKGEVAAVMPRGSGLAVRIEGRGLVTASDPLVLGESIAVNGACLTVTRIDGSFFDADVLEETLRCTMLGSLTVGDAVNLERALKWGERLGGHIVSGHVDEVGRLIQRRRAGEDTVYTIGCTADFARGVVRKGSVTLSGVSLTVVAVQETSFEVALIPMTLRETTLGALPVGGRVNLEADILGAYVRRALGQDDTQARRWIAAGFAD